MPSLDVEFKRSWRKTVNRWSEVKEYARQFSDNFLKDVSFKTLAIS